MISANARLYVVRIRYAFRNRLQSSSLPIYQFTNFLLPRRLLSLMVFSLPHIPFASASRTPIRQQVAAPSVHYPSLPPRAVLQRCSEEMSIPGSGRWLLLSLRRSVAGHIRDSAVVGRHRARILQHEGLCGLAWSDDVLDVPARREGRQQEGGQSEVPSAGVEGQQFAASAMVRSGTGEAQCCMVRGWATM